VPGHALASAKEARAEHVVRASTCHRLEDTLEVRRVVLAVAVEVNRGGVALVAGDLEAGAQGGAESARALHRMHARAVLAPDGGRRIARAVVHEQDVQRQPTGGLRDPGKHAADHRRLIARDHDGEAARAGLAVRRLHERVLRRHERPAACRLGLRNAEQASDRRRELEHRAWLARDPSRRRTLAPDDERHRPLAPVEMPVAADPAALAVVGHEDHSRAVEPAALLEELEEAAHVAVGLDDLVEVFGAAHAAHVAELVGGEQLEHQQIGVLFLHHPSALGH
jgi:hypothetical protein